MKRLIALTIAVMGLLVALETSVLAIPPSNGEPASPAPGNCQGQKGDQGDTGPQGPQGDTGEKGERGDKGLTGDPGKPGGRLVVLQRDPRLNDMNADHGSIRAGIQGEIDNGLLKGRDPLRKPDVDGKYVKGPCPVGKAAVLAGRGRDQAVKIAKKYSDDADADQDRENEQAHNAMWARMGLILPQAGAIAAVLLLLAGIVHIAVHHNNE